MRAVLNGIYDAAAWLAAAFLVGLLVMVLTSIAGRALHFYVPGTDAYAGYLMAGAGFLALAHTLKRGEHIRVTLLLMQLHGPWHKALELWALGVGSLLALLFAFFSVRLAWQSRVFNDISTAHDATPLWIPQIAMAVGAILFAVALVDDLLVAWRRPHVEETRSPMPAPSIHE
ncbi:MAG TPA: TRAP transporter small permease [Burkholderiaceae bacterium]|nr:TRAP transporter small permease [Burkholderiaceae bacterium]